MSMSEWISVKERMPTPWQAVLIHRSNIDLLPEVIIYAGTKDIDFSHWMPIPLAPKDK